jgi:hypothetical protein
VFRGARARARSLVEHLSPESDVALVLGSEGTAAPVAEPSTDRARVLAALDAAAARRGARTSAARCARAAQILHAAARTDRVIYVVTDLQATGGTAWTGRRGGGPVVVRRRGRPWENRAVVSLTAEPAPRRARRGARSSPRSPTSPTRPARSSA